MAKKKSSSKKSTTSKKSSSNESTKQRTPTPAEARGVEKGDPVHVDSTTARSDEDARVGQFAKVVSGKHQGRYGVFDHVSEYKTNGYPKKIVIFTRDEHNEPIVVDYKDARPAEAGFRGTF